MADCTNPRLGDMLHAWELGMIAEEAEKGQICLERFLERKDKKSIINSLIIRC